MCGQFYFKLFSSFFIISSSGMCLASCLQQKYIHMLPQPGPGLAGNSKFGFPLKPRGFFHLCSLHRTPPGVKGSWENGKEHVSHEATGSPQQEPLHVSVGPKPLGALPEEMAVPLTIKVESSKSQRRKIRQLPSTGTFLLSALQWSGSQILPNYYPNILSELPFGGAKHCWKFCQVPTD